MHNAIKYFKPDCNDFRTVARALTLVENDLDGGLELLKKLTFKKNAPIIGITGPPGAGKSTLVNSIISSLVAKGAQSSHPGYRSYIAL